MTGNRMIFALMVCAIIMTSCGSYKDFTYMQDVNDFEEFDITGAAEVCVRKGDVLNIFVSSRNPESAKPFNLSATANSARDTYASYASQRALGYQVDGEGNIEFPQLGSVHCEGMTRKQLGDTIKGMLIDGGYLIDPIVTIEFENLRISVIGEVARPGSYPMNNDHTTLLEALSLAGDLTVYGRRDRVAVIREVNGKRTVVYHDLRSKEIFQSPRYYLQQNDVVYVEPNKAKATQSSASRWNQPSVWFSAVSSIVSVVTLVKVFL
ncbi:MAG: polysaccharide biosynthesis/export family protein [Bacteroidales bacterium]|nr:polysaccharide biosynthesis/export family protein [Bacteroidales bacterium]